MSSFLCLFAGCQAPASPQGKTSGALVWSDEFEGTAVDQAKWSYETGAGGWGNNELQYYRTENTAVEPIPGEAGRALVITARKEVMGSSNYTSSRLKTQGKASWKYGRIEARIRLPEGKGTFPAFWMLGNSITSVKWPQCGEIDVVETIGGSTGYNSDYKVYGTAHWADAAGVHADSGGSKILPSKVSADFHVYAVDWTPSGITWSVDGADYFYKNTTGSDTAEFQAPFFLLLNFAVGGNWGGPPDATTVWPQKMWVDWVRVYQNS